MWVFRYLFITLAILGIGVTLGMAYYRFDPWHQPTSYPSTDSSLGQSRTVSCFISGWDCAKLERVEQNGQFYGYGVKDSTGSLIAPFTGSLTTGLMHFTDPANPRYLTLILYQADPQGSRLTYIVPADTPASPKAIAYGEALIPVPTQTAMPPFGPYQVVITATDTDGEIIDPKEFLAP